MGKKNSVEVTYDPNSYLYDMGVTPKDYANLKRLHYARCYRIHSHIAKTFRDACGQDPRISARSIALITGVRQFENKLTASMRAPFNLEDMLAIGLCVGKPIGWLLPDIEAKLPKQFYALTEKLSELIYLAELGADALLERGDSRGEELHRLITLVRRYNADCRDLIKNQAGLAFGCYDDLLTDHKYQTSARPFAIFKRELAAQKAKFRQSQNT